MKQKTSLSIKHNLIPVLFTLVSLIFISLLNTVQAVKFYPYGNPCTADPLYYEDAADVLYDLSSFSSLYIKYEGCAYSPRSDLMSDDENGDGENWYLGFNYKQGANISYSLYGIKKGRNSVRKCTKGTFIGSFYSLDGLNSFSYAAGIDLSSFYYTLYYNYNNNRNLKEEDREHRNQKSFGLYCNENNQLVEAVFTNRNINPIYYYNTIDDLTDLNKALSKVSCTKIYDSNSYYDDYATNLITYSSTCSIYDGDQCPDRYGKLAGCEQKFKSYAKSIEAIVQNKMTATQYRFICGSILYIVAGMLVCYKQKKVHGHVHKCTDVWVTVIYFSMMILVSIYMVIFLGVFLSTVFSCISLK